MTSSTYKAIPLGQVLGRVDLTAVVLHEAAAVAQVYFQEAEEAAFSGDPVETRDIPDWIPRIEEWLPSEVLKGLGLKRSAHKPELVMTVDTQAHVDNIHGAVLFLVLHNDGLAFKQGRQRHITSPGEYFIFDDRLKHQVSSKAKTTTYLGIAVPLDEIPHSGARHD